MGERDKDFLCPDCFCQVIQTISKFNGEIVYFCRRCGLGPLVFCKDCLSLITVDSVESFSCPFCETAVLLAEELENISL